MQDNQFNKKIKITDGVTVSVYIPTFNYTSNQSVVLALTTYTRDGHSCTTTSVTLDEAQVSAIADALNAALGQAWPKEF